MLINTFLFCFLIDTNREIIYYNILIINDGKLYYFLNGKKTITIFGIRQ